MAAVVLAVFEVAAPGCHIPAAGAGLVRFGPVVGADLVRLESAVGVGLVWLGPVVEADLVARRGQRLRM